MSSAYSIGGMSDAEPKLGARIRPLRDGRPKPHPNGIEGAESHGRRIHAEPEMKARALHFEGVLQKFEGDALLRRVRGHDSNDKRPRTLEKIRDVAVQREAHGEAILSDAFLKKMKRQRGAARPPQ